LWLPLADVRLHARPAVWQLWPAMALYLVLSIWLVATTIEFRRRYSRVEVFRDEFDAEWLVFPMGRIPTRDIREGRESIISYFERRARKLDLIDNQGRSWVVNDGLFGYEHFRWLIAEGFGISISSLESADVMHRIGERWRRRHEHFTDDPVRGRFHPRTSRGVLLVPVLIVDLIFTGAAHALLDGAGLHDWAPFIARLGLLLSAAAARHTTTAC
jgi:hypothetical protein